MNIKYFTPVLFLLFILSSCAKDAKEMLIGKWQVDQVEILEEINPIEKQDLQRMEGAVMEFMEDGMLQINMEGENHENKWYLENNVLKVENGIEFKVQEITENKLILEGELSYYKEGEMVTYDFTQHMSKV